MNDAERLSQDPVMRTIVDRKGLDRLAASTSQMGRLETDWLATDDNLAALTDLTGVWIDRVHKRKPPKMTVLDMDSSVSPAYGDQEGSAHNGHRLHLPPSAIPVQPPQMNRNFYNLVLHPVHDRFEQNQFGLTPRGSILEWIDAFYEYSKSDLDRTAGKLTNVERIVTILDELLLDPNLKGNVNLHVFGLRTGGPTKHGEFSEIVVPEDNEYVIVPVTFKYWLLMFWRENYKKIDDCRSRNTQLFVKRERDSDQRIFFHAGGGGRTGLAEDGLGAPGMRTHIRVQYSRYLL